MEKLKLLREMEKLKLQKVLDAYTRYLGSFKQKECDSEGNFKALKRFVNKYCDGRLKTHIVQDAYLNLLRRNNSKYDEIQPSSVISLLMDSQDNMEKALELLQTNPIDEPFFKVLKEKYYTIINEADFKELSWDEYNNFKNSIINEVNMTSSIPLSVQRRVMNVLRVKFDRDKWKLITT